MGNHYSLNNNQKHTDPSFILQFRCCLPSFDAKSTVTLFNRWSSRSSTSACTRTCIRTCMCSTVWLVEMYSMGEEMREEEEWMTNTKSECQCVHVCVYVSVLAQL